MSLISFRQDSDYTRDGHMLRTIVVIQASVLATTILGSSILHPSIDAATVIAGGLALLGLLWGISRPAQLLGFKTHPVRYAALYQLLVAIIVIVSPQPSAFPLLWLSAIALWCLVVNASIALYSLLLFGCTLAGISLLSIDVVGHGAYFVSYFGAASSTYMLLRFMARHNDSQKHIVSASVESVGIERQRLTALINSMTVGFIATDSKGVIRMYNAAALSIIDTNQSIIGKELTDVLALYDDQNKRSVELKKALETNKILISRDLKIKYNADEYANLYINFSPIRTGYGKKAEFGHIVTFRDITKEKSLEEERDEFISVISHELRTPIAVSEASVSNAMFIAKRDKGSQIIQTALDTAHTQIRYLGGIVNDLSTLARAERGALKAEVGRVNLHELMAALEHDYKPEAAQKGLSFKTHIARSTPAEISTSQLYLREVLQNFITNAIKYSDEGGVRIDLAKQDGGVVFSVQDSGIGMSVSDQKKLFQKFFRSEDYRTRKRNGTGLGLYITKKLAKLLQAQITVESTLNEGSTFKIYVPDMSSSSSKK